MPLHRGDFKVIKRLGDGAQGAMNEGILLVRHRATAQH